MKFAVIGKNPIRNKIITRGLFEAGHHKVVLLHADKFVESVKAVHPDFLIVDLENPDRETLAKTLRIVEEFKLPTAIFVDKSDPPMTKAAIESGVAAYIVDGLKKERVGPIVDMAVVRFRSLNRLLEELNESKIALADRKVVERAKGILMKRRNLSEEEAYESLRKCAMDEKKRLVDIAQSILTAEKVAGKVMI